MLNAHHSHRDWGNSLIAELIDKLMTFFPRKRNSIVIAPAKAGQLIKGPNRGDYWIEIIVLDGKTRRWFSVEQKLAGHFFNPQQRATLLCLCDRGGARENDDVICSECVLQKIEVSRYVCMLMCVYYLCSEAPHPSHQSSQGLHHTLCSYGYTCPGPGTHVH